MAENKWMTFEKIKQLTRDRKRDTLIKSRLTGKVYTMFYDEENDSEYPDIGEARYKEICDYWCIYTNDVNVDQIKFLSIEEEADLYLYNYGMLKKRPGTYVYVRFHEGPPDDDDSLIECDKVFIAKPVDENQVKLLEELLKKLSEYANYKA